MITLSAFGDESVLEASAGGFYVLAAVVFDVGVHEVARTALAGLRGKRPKMKLHWNDMDAQQRRSATKAIADLPGFHVVTVGTPVPLKRQERARAACLTRLVVELHDFGVNELCLESRTTALNARDIATARGARFSLPPGARFHVVHLPGKSERLLWAADIVAGAVRTDRMGMSGYRELLNDRIYEVEVPTSC
ncbi:hypothetical protein [Saccharopolyspora sp. 5N708]|uniref:hypothetical protein n=1 Tax=Saccharopolyspora sp. 5N708 TaxID=3457424 RepID=UPI003FD302CF